MVGARSGEDIGFTMLVWCVGTCYLVLVFVPGSASATGCRCKAKAEAGECQQGNSGRTKGVLGVFRVFQAVDWPGVGPALFRGSPGDGEG